MAVPAQTVQTLTRTNMREDLEDAIYSLDPVATPILSMAKKMTATAKYHEWNTDELAAAASNKHVEGDNDAADASTATVRPGNRLQILKKTASTSGSVASVDLAGTRSEMAYQMAKRSKELKRDLEFAISRNTGTVTGNGTNTAAQMAGIEAYITTNVEFANNNTGYAAGGFSNGAVTAPTDPTSAAGVLAETKLTSLVASCWTNGAEPDVLITGAFNRQKVSTFDGIATLYRDTAPKIGPASIIASADIYVSDFSGQGGIKIMADRFMRPETVLLLDFEYLGVAYLRPMQSYELGKTGDSEQRTILCEATVQVSNEKAHGKILKCTTS